MIGLSPKGPTFYYNHIGLGFQHLNIEGNTQHIDLVSYRVDQDGDRKKDIFNYVNTIEITVDQISPFPYVKMSIIWSVKLGDGLFIPSWKLNELLETLDCCSVPPSLIGDVEFHLFSHVFLKECHGSKCKDQELTQVQSKEQFTIYSSIS